MNTTQKVHAAWLMLQDQTQADDLCSYRGMAGGQLELLVDKAAMMRWFRDQASSRYAKMAHASNDNSFTQ
jgi:hypothetical protein